MLILCGRQRCKRCACTLVYADQPVVAAKRTQVQWARHYARHRLELPVNTYEIQKAEITIPI